MMDSADERLEVIRKRCEICRVHVENVEDAGQKIFVELEGDKDAMSSITGDIRSDVYLHETKSAEQGVVVLRRDG